MQLTHCQNLTTARHETRTNTKKRIYSFTRLRSEVQSKSWQRLRCQELRGLTWSGVMNQHGAPSAASPHRLMPQSLPKQLHGVKQRPRSLVVEEIYIELSSKIFFDISLRLKPRNNQQAPTLPLGASRQPVRPRRIFTRVQLMPPNSDIHHCAGVHVRDMANFVDALGL